MAVSFGELDDDFSSFGGNSPVLVIGQHQTAADGGIKQVEVREFGQRISAERFVDVIRPEPSESHIVAAVNAKVDAFMSTKEAAELINQGHSRTSFVHFELERALKEHRARQASVAQQPPVVSPLPTPLPSQVFPPPAAWGTPTLPAEHLTTPPAPTAVLAAPPIPSATQSVDYAAIFAAMQAQQASQAMAAQRVPDVPVVEPSRTADFSSLGIPELFASATVPSYCRLVMDGDVEGAVRFRYHWGIQVNEESVILVYDQRYKKLKSGLRNRLLKLQSATADLYTGVDPAAVKEADPLRLLLPVQIFEFGCFVFMVFLQAE